IMTRKRLAGLIFGPLLLITVALAQTKSQVDQGLEMHGNELKVFPQVDLRISPTKYDEFREWPTVSWTAFEQAARRARGCDPKQGWHKVVEGELTEIPELARLQERYRASISKRGR
ncbi:MAG TPA: hypothetical protein VG944_24260, partial [Fimbriimonas sp.]|nr:hypothetical protein [Fimbriimonas sp.]